ncbi:MAG TPA: hemolysin family protein [Candidatus Eisenbacteria bacterium]|nr:hemolysin family protein [Candidatus Eisenbacteria bacterium]
MLTEVGVIVALILMNGLFAMSEMAIVAARKSRLEDWAKNGNRRAKTALELAQTPNRFLSAVQVGITLIGIVAGALGATTLAHRLAAYVAWIPQIEPFSGEIALGLVVLTIGYFSLLLGELVPKRLALLHPETIASAIAVPLELFSKVFAPLVHVLSFSTDMTFRLLGRQPAQQPPVTEEEIKTLVQKGTEAGVFEESEQDMLEAVLRLGDRTAPSLMTPRTQIAWLDLEASDEEIRNTIISSGHSRFPAANASLDNVIGIVQAKDLLANCLAGKPFDPRACVQESLFVPRSLSALEILDQFKQSGQHIALVVDEYGGIEGLVTHHDILEAIAGDIPFSEKQSEKKAIQRHDGSWLLDGMLTIEEFKEIFQVESFPGEKREAYQTLGGFVFTHFGRVPAVSDSFEWNNLRFEVVDMDGKRIDKVLVSAVPVEARRPYEGGHRAIPDADD